MNPLGVYIVASKFAPHAGGTAVVWTNWCCHWPASQITVVAPKVAGYKQFDALQGYRILRCGYPDIPKIRMPWLWLNQAATMAAICLKKRPALVHLSHVFENGFLGPLLKRYLGIPYFLHTYGEELQFALRFPWLRNQVARALKHAAGVTTISRYTAGLHAEFGFHKQALLVHPAVDNSRFRPRHSLGLAQSKFGIPEGRLLLTTGRLMERKGHDWVINLLPELLAQFPDLHYAIVGVGPYEGRLRQLTHERALTDRVHFLGRVSDEDLPALMCEATLFVHPNRSTPEGDVEGFGIVFLEAAACGLPVIGGRSGGTPDAVKEGVNGVLIVGEAELKAQLIRLLSEPELLVQMGRAGPDFARNFQWKTSAGRVWDYCFERIAAVQTHE